MGFLLAVATVASAVACTLSFPTMVIAARAVDDSVANGLDSTPWLSSYNVKSRPFGLYTVYTLTIIFTCRSGVSFCSPFFTQSTGTPFTALEGSGPSQRAASRVYATFVMTAVFSALVFIISFLSAKITEAQVGRLEGGGVGCITRTGVRGDNGVFATMLSVCYTVLAWEASVSVPAFKYEVVAWRGVTGGQIVDQPMFVTAQSVFPLTATMAALHGIVALACLWTFFFGNADGDEEHSLTGTNAQRLSAEESQADAPRVIVCEELEEVAATVACEQLSVRPDVFCEADTRVVVDHSSCDPDPGGDPVASTDAIERLPAQLWGGGGVALSSSATGGIDKREGGPPFEATGYCAPSPHVPLK